MMLLLLLMILAGQSSPAPMAAPAGAAASAPDTAVIWPGCEAAWESPLGRLRDTTLVGVGVVGGPLLAEDADHGLTALDPDTGTIRWFVRLPGRLDPWPAAGANTLVLCSGTDMIAVDAASGRRLGRLSTPSLAAGSPVCDGQMVYIPSVLGNRVVAVNLADGLTTWDFPMGSPFSGPALLLGDAARRSVVVACDDGTLRAVPAQPAVPETERWVAPAGRLAGPVVSDGRRLFAATAERALVALDAGSGSTLWRFLPGEPLTGPAVVADKLVIVGTSGHVIALDAATGAVRWQRAQADVPLSAGNRCVHVARGSGTALLDLSDGRDVLTGLPRDSILVGDLLIDLQQQATVLVAMRIVR